MINYSFIKLKILDIGNFYNILGENIIGSTGIKYLIKVDLPVLENLSFSNDILIQLTVKWKCRGSNIYRKGDGQTSCF